MSDLKIALLVDSVNVSKYVYELADWAAKQSGIGLSHVLIHDNPRTQLGKLKKIQSVLVSNGVLQAIREMVFSGVSWLDALLLSLSVVHRNHLQAMDIRSLGVPIIKLHPDVSRSGHVYRFRKEDIESLRQLQLDVLIRCGSGILKGDILNVSKFGVLSFHHGDNRVNRGGPAGFWEVFYRNDQTGFVIQQLTEELDGGKVLMRGSFATRFHYLLNQAELYAKSNTYLMDMLATLALNRSLPQAELSLPYFNRLYRKPRIFESLLYALKTLSLIVKKVVVRAVGKRSRWGVAYAKCDWRDLVMWKAVRIKNRPHHFIADPFVISRNSETVCFVEEFDYKAGRGHIAAYDLSAAHPRFLGPVLKEPFHLSFPFVFEFEGTLYMCPETSDAKQIRLYECVEYPISWKHSHVLIDGVRAADTILFPHDGAWWLFTSIDRSGVGDFCSELQIYSATSPLSSCWTPHKMNPVIVDASCARNAGFFMDGNTMFRVAQKQGFDQYGAGVSVRRIVHLNPDIYIEEPQVAIEPSFSSGLRGTHHLHTSGKVTVFDVIEKTRISQ